MRSVYVHWPFCLSRCAYCDFVSGTDLSRMQDYTAALLSEIRGAPGAGPLDTVFFGGGTPSLCPAGDLAAILEALRGRFGIREGAEITVEMNPRTAAPGWLAAARGAGVSRISMGLQAVQEHHLRLLGRRHSAADFAESFAEARRAGLRNLSIDLIYGLPGQTMAEWLESLHFACGLRPEHISCYALSIEDRTPLAEAVSSGRVPAPDDDLAADMYIGAQRFLRQQGFRQYEISNFARPGFLCRHNLRYWTLEEYLGLGAGAHSFLSGVRSANTSDVQAYIETALRRESAAVWRESTSPAEREREFLMLRTRLPSGFSPAEFEAGLGRPFAQDGRAGLREALRLGLLRREEGRYRPTELGLRFQSRIARLLMDDVNEV